MPQESFFRVNHFHKSTKSHSEFVLTAVIVQHVRQKLVGAVDVVVD